jgi:hypothetical protein
MTQNCTTVSILHTIPQYVNTIFLFLLILSALTVSPLLMASTMGFMIIFQMGGQYARVMDPVYPKGSTGVSSVVSRIWYGLYANIWWSLCLYSLNRIAEESGCSASHET